MSNFGEHTRIVGRKKHRCEYCLGPIPTGESHLQFKGMWDGEWQNWRMHDECIEDYRHSGEQEFMPGDGEIPQRIKELEKPRCQTK